jgi:predicted AAA+ superfamily ATPase
MAITNHDRVGKAMELLKGGLGPFVDREFRNIHRDKAKTEIQRFLGEDRLNARKVVTSMDVAALLKIMWDSWNEVFRLTLGPAERSLVSELREHRNRWAHQEAFSSDDAYRALDSSGRLLTAVSAPQADDIEKMKTELLRLRFDEQARNERRKSAGTAIEAAASGLKPWREVVAPHKDVASGRYQQAEFAADLWQVHIGEGTDEYRNPIEFFRRTFLTESLSRMLVGAVQRLAGTGGDPVVQLQTNFGGGKTHSMLALYHLFSGISPSALPGVDEMLEQSKIQNPESKIQNPESKIQNPESKIPSVQRVVLVGNKISPGNPSTKPDGTVVRTLWGELAWQLGGPKAFARIKADDEQATSPGDALRTLFNAHGPCLILIDEWVAYARQLHDHGDMPAGTFETQFTFAQALTESAKAAKNCLLVISLPASDTSGSPHSQAEDVEVGGIRGREALDRLRNVVGRVEAAWRPASAEEGFEIVRRRLFEPMTDPAQFRDRDVVARAFADLYRTQHQEFPPECRDADYEKRIKAAYPIHPEVFDRLYNDWSTLVKFQRTRGVLRLMASVIHSLWEKGDKTPLILPANIAIDDPRVQFEMTRYLSDNWPPVIEKDVDGPSSLPLRTDGEVPNLGKFSACRRVARTIYLGSAPTAAAAHRGLEDRRVKLGCVLPGESPAIFGDALRRLAGTATFLYQDGPRFWYSTQPTVTKLAEDRAEQLKREPDKVVIELDRRLRANLRQPGDFSRIHPMPQGGQDVPDDQDARLVVLRVEHPYSKEPGCLAEAAARAILESRGNTPRLYRNTLIFLAADKTRWQDLDEAIRKYLAWESIVAEQDEQHLNLTPQQVKQAETQQSAADGTVNARIPEVYQWLLVPVQKSRQAAAIDFQTIRLAPGQEPLAVRASKKLKHDELLLTSYAGTLLRMELDRVPLWRGDHVSVKQLAEDFARYPYLPRLKSPAVLVGAVKDGLSLLTWSESFGYADSFDEARGRYQGLRGGRLVDHIDESSPSLLVKPETARRQLEEDVAKGGGTRDGRGGSDGTGSEGDGPDGRNGGAKDGKDGREGRGGGPLPEARPKRFHGTVILNADRVGRDAGKIAEEVIAHLTGLVGATVTVTLEIEAEIPSGAPNQVVRTVTENSRTLGFSSQGFEKD